MKTSAHEPNPGRPYQPDYANRPPLEQRVAGVLRHSIKRRVQSALQATFGALGWLTRAQTPGGSLRAGDPALQRILVVRVDLLGDTVLSTPAVRALRRAYPRATIDMLVTPSTAPLLRDDPDIARVHAFDPHRWRQPTTWLRPASWREAARFARQVRATRYDLAISISGDLGSIVTWLSGARRRVGYAGEAYPYFLTDPVPGRRYAVHQHEVRYVLDLAQAAGGIVEPRDEQPVLHVAPDARQSLQCILAAARAALGRHGPIITLHSGARNGQAKRWPPEHLATLADRLSAELDALVVLTGAPHETPLACEVASRATLPVLNLAGKTSVSELVALLAASDLLVTGDSGPMHIACAVSTPVVALHGPTDPAISGPTTSSALVLRRAVYCSPCYDASATAECRYSNPVCMKSLAPALVFAAARRQLEGCSHVPGTRRPLEGSDQHASTLATPSHP